MRVGEEEGQKRKGQEKKIEKCDKALYVFGLVFEDSVFFCWFFLVCVVIDWGVPSYWYSLHYLSCCALNTNNATNEIRYDKNEMPKRRKF